jgi:hypothetical protein
VVWNYRVLWVFGIILALATAGGVSEGARYNDLGNEDFSRVPWFRTVEVPAEVKPILGSTLLAVVLGLLGVILLLVVVTAIARYVSETALIRMVDEYEKTGERRTLREGFRMGWSFTALRLFLIDLLVGLPVVLASVMLFILALAPLLLWVTKDMVAGVLGTLATGGLHLSILFLVIVVGTALSLLTKFFKRACVLEDLGVIESLRRGFYLVRHNLKDVAVMWFIMLIVGLGWILVMIAVTLVLLPVAILLIVVGVTLGGLPGLLMYGLASLVFEGAVPWIVAAVIGVPIFLFATVVMAIVAQFPSLVLNGVMEVFKSSVWTLTYRELPVAAVEPRALAEPDVAGLEAASAA